MDFYSMTDKGIMAELGGRLRSLRLRRNLTQEEVAQATALSLNTIKALEAGRGKLSSLIAVLRELGALEGLDNLISEAPISPLQLARQQGKVRQRASGKRARDEQKEPAEW